MTLDSCVCKPCIKDRVSMRIFSTILDEHLLTTYGPQPARQKNVARRIDARTVGHQQ